MPLNPEALFCTLIKSCTTTNYWLRSKLYRDTSPVPIYQLSATETNSRPLSWLCTTTLVMLKLNLYLDCKNCAVLSSHRDSLLAKVPAPSTRGARMLRRVTLTNYNRRAVMFKRCCAFLDRFALISSLYLS
jgi:hypothetical protein